MSSRCSDVLDLEKVHKITLVFLRLPVVQSSAIAVTRIVENCDCQEESWSKIRLKIRCWSENFVTSFTSNILVFNAKT